MFRRSSIVAAFIALLAAPSWAATVVGTESLALQDDLTVIETDAGDRLQFLDLTVTDGLSITEAESSWAGLGFRVATIADVTELFVAFAFPSLPADPTGWDIDVLAAAPSAVSHFQAMLGLTNTTLLDTFSGGFIDDETADGEAALVNVRSTDGGTVFLNHAGLSDEGTASSTIGVFLVRDEPVARMSAVPLPASGWALVAGLAAVGASRRWRR